jgi:hypothetical protein
MHSVCAFCLLTMQNGSSRFQLIDLYALHSRVVVDLEDLNRGTIRIGSLSRVEEPLVFVSRKIVLLCILLNATYRILLFPPRIVPFTALGRSKRPRSFASYAFSLLPSLSESFLSFRSVPLTSQSKTQSSHL